MCCRIMPFLPHAEMHLLQGCQINSITLARIGSARLYQPAVTAAIIGCLCTVFQVRAVLQLCLSSCTNWLTRGRVSYFRSQAVQAVPYYPRHGTEQTSKLLHRELVMKEHHASCDDEHRLQMPHNVECQWRRHCYEKVGGQRHCQPKTRAGQYPGHCCRCVFKTQDGARCSRWEADWLQHGHHDSQQRHSCRYELVEQLITCTAAMRCTFRVQPPHLSHVTYM